MDEKHKLDVKEIACFRSMCGVTRMESRRNEEVRRKVSVKEDMSERVDRKMLKWFGHVERMSEERFIRL